MFNFVVCRLDCMMKNETFAQMLLHKVKQQNEMGVVGKFYTVDVLTVYSTYTCRK